MAEGEEKMLLLGAAPCSRQVGVAWLPPHTLQFDFGQVILLLWFPLLYSAFALLCHLTHGLFSLFPSQIAATAASIAPRDAIETWMRSAEHLCFC